MSYNAPTTTSAAERVRPEQGGYGAEIDRPQRHRSTETKASFKTTELIAYVAAVIAVIVTSCLVGTTSGHADYFRADKAMFYVVLLTLGYLGSRGLAKSGSREHDNS
jgi:hypothetical protein